MAVRRRSTRSLAKPATPCDFSQIDHTADALGEFDLPDRHATSCLPRSYRSKDAGSAFGTPRQATRGTNGPHHPKADLYVVATIVWKRRFEENTGGALSHPRPPPGGAGPIVGSTEDREPGKAPIRH